MKDRQPKIKEITSAKNGTTYRSFQVYWTDDNGKFQRKQFSDRQSASIFAAATHTALLGKESAHSIRSTVLTLDQLRDAEQAFSRIAPKYSLEEVVDHFFKTHHTQDFEISLTEAGWKQSEDRFAIVASSSQAHCDSFGTSLVRSLCILSPRTTLRTS